MSNQTTKPVWTPPGLTEVIPRVYRLPLVGTGAFLLLEDQITVIDAGWRGNGRRVLESLSAMGRFSEEISYVVSTHNHLDHVGGIGHICQSCPAKVAAHEADVPLTLPNGHWSLPNPARHPALALLINPLINWLKPDQFAVDIQLQHGSRLDTLGGMEVVHCPGHTPGSISLHFPQEGLLMVGDAMQCRGGKLGLPSRWFTADMGQAKESIRRLAQLDFEVLCFSHFPPIKKGAARLLRQFAESLDDRAVP
jgi:glyoxylase-like metal-dependent hydrolase (beta-lactamase superfamily II)